MIGLKKVTILFSRKYKRGEGPSDKNVAPTLEKELGVKVFETTFKTPAGFQRVLNRIDKLTDDGCWSLSVIVVHYSDPSIFNGLIQRTIAGRFFLFYDEKTKNGGLSHASVRGIGVRKLNKIYEFKTSDVSDLFFGGNPDSGHYAKVYQHTRYHSDITRLFPLAQPWRLLKVNDFSLSPIYAEAYKAVYLGETRKCRHYSAILWGPNTFKPIEVDKYEPLLCTAFKYRAHPFEIREAWPILGTQFVIISDDTRDNWPDGDIAIVYLGHDKPKSIDKLKTTVYQIIVKTNQTL